MIHWGNIWTSACPGPAWGYIKMKFQRYQEMQICHHVSSPSMMVFMCRSYNLDVVDKVQAEDSNWTTWYL